MTFRTLILLFAFMPMWAFSQNDTLIKKQLRKQRPAYIKVGLGTGYSYFRDFATSPLNYGGLPLNIFLSRLKSDSLRENELAFSYYRGTFYASVEENVGISVAHVFNLNYSRLYGIPSLSANGWNVKVGGLFDGAFSLRNNEALGNNSGGAEIFTTLFVSTKVTRDFSRNTLKHKKFWFINYTLNPRKQALSFRLNLALINSTYRNGYAYNGQSYLVNDDKTFDNYQFKIFSGYRMSSSLDYTYYLKNKNAMQFSYIWDAYQTGGDLDKFEMAHHTLRISLLFSTK